MAAYNEKNLWTVPLEDRGSPGILLSDRIRLYIEAVHMMHPEDFIESDLRPASYDLHVGEKYYVNDKPFKLRPKGQIEIPANGLVYVLVNERFNIPYYMVARYSLRVTQVYRGLLIDNGLQIDPGFHGQIYVPIHNFTDQSRSLRLGEPFLSIEFTRAETLPSSDQITSEAELLRLASSKKLLGADQQRLVLFAESIEKSLTQRTPEDFWAKYPGEKHASSILGLAERVTREVRRIEIAGLVGALVAILLFLGGFLPWVMDLYKDSHSKVTEFSLKLEDLSKQISNIRDATPPQPTPAASLEEQIRQLEEKIKGLRDELNSKKGKQ